MQIIILVCLHSGTNNCNEQINKTYRPGRIQYVWEAGLKHWEQNQGVENFSASMP